AVEDGSGLAGQWRPGARLGEHRARDQRDAVELLMRAIDELRDPWALGVAAAAGVVAYAATVPWQYALVAALVVVAFRVGAGLLLTALAPRTAAPVPDIPLRPDDRGPLFGETLTPSEPEVAALLYGGM